MNKKTIVGWVLIFGIFVGWMFWMMPTKEEIREHQKQDSIRYAEQMAARDSAIAAQLRADREDSLYRASMNIPELRDSLNRVRQQQRLDSMGVFAVNGSHPNTRISVKNDVFNVSFQSQGASVQEVMLNDYVTFDSMPLRVVSPSDNNLNLQFYFDNQLTHTKDIVFVPYVDGLPLDEDAPLNISGNDSVTLCFRAFVASNDTLSSFDIDRYLEFRYVLYGNSYEIDFDIEFHGIAQGVSSSRMEMVWQNNLLRQEKHDKSRENARNARNADPERFYTSLYYKSLRDKAHHLKDGNNDAKQITLPIEWIAYKQQFFSSIIMSDSAFCNANNMQQDFSNADNLCTMSTTLGIDYYAGNKSNQTIDMRLFYGPNKYQTLKHLDRSIERLLPLGWGFFLTQWTSRFLIIPIFNILSQFNWNYGIIIIVLTLIFKIILLPLTYPSYKTSAVMRHLRPEMDAINKRYPDQDQMMQKQQAMQALQKKAGINPMAGCLPALVQMPILYAMFRFFPASIELRQQPFLWCDDLSSYDSILNLGFTIPGYGDHVSLFCLIMFGVNFFYTWWTMRQQQSQAQMPGMKFMMYFMPFMMLFFLNSQSAALNIYYCVNLLFTILIMWGIRLFITEDRVRKKMEKNSNKMASRPQKKSKFQQRLEEMQKMTEQMQKQQQAQRSRK